MKKLEQATFDDCMEFLSSNTKSSFNVKEAFVQFVSERRKSFPQDSLWTTTIRQGKSGDFSVDIATIAQSDDTQTRTYSIAFRNT